MEDYLIIDIGSTYTKVRVFNNEKLVATSQSPTVVDDISIGIISAKNKILIDSSSIRHRLASSSAAGGLRMVAMGYMAKVTAKAAKEVAMNSGAKILEIISSEDLPEYRIEVLKEINPDIILLAGGTDFGDENSIIENAKLIIKSSVKAVVIIAGNIVSQPEVEKLFLKAQIKYKRIPNIMPTIHELKVDLAREVIHKEFIKQIIKAKGIEKLSRELTSERVIPTPGAVLMATELLAKGTYLNKGIGNILVIDLGGATTDIHSVIPSLEKISNEEKGLIVSNEKQFSYRTVEGNLGMRISVSGILEILNPEIILKKKGIIDDIKLEKFKEYCKKIENEPMIIAENEYEYEFDTYLAESAIEIALKRHAGFISTIYDPITGIIPGMPIGRDLRNIDKIIGVGGIFAHRDYEAGIDLIKNALKDKGVSLLPISPEIILDKNYILYTGGVISQIDSEYAFQVLKNNLIKNKEEEMI